MNFRIKAAGLLAALLLVSAVGAGVPTANAAPECPAVGPGSGVDASGIGEQGHGSGQVTPGDPFVGSGSGIGDQGQGSGRVAPGDPFVGSGSGIGDQGQGRC
jgi:hypothetical protein